MKIIHQTINYGKIIKDGNGVPKLEIIISDSENTDNSAIKVYHLEPIGLDKLQVCGDCIDHDYENKTSYDTFSISDIINMNLEKPRLHNRLMLRRDKSHLDETTFFFENDKVRFLYLMAMEAILYFSIWYTDKMLASCNSDDESPIYLDSNNIFKHRNRKILQNFALEVYEYVKDCMKNGN